MESPNTQPRPKVLITGINGFISAQVAAAFLRAGYSVRGSCWSRNPVPDQLLDALYREIPHGKDRGPSFVEVVEMEDITRPGSFDEAVKGKSISPGSPLRPR
jgi:nucleoside-diphosphate-sugar epimerase